MVYTHSCVDFRHRVKDYQPTLPEKLVNKEDPKNNKHCSLEKGKGSQSSEQTESMGRGGGSYKNEKGRRGRMQMS